MSDIGPVLQAQVDVLNGVASALEAIWDDPATPDDLIKGLIVASKIVHASADKISERGAT